MDADDCGDDVAELSDRLRVIADEKRLRILKLLTRQEMCVCDIMTELNLSQSLASHHLGILKQAGLVRDRRDAQWVYYSIDPDRLAELKERYQGLLDVTNLAAAAAYGAGRRKS